MQSDFLLMQINYASRCRASAPGKINNNNNKKHAIARSVVENQKSIQSHSRIAGVENLRHGISTASAKSEIEKDLNQMNFLFD